MRNQPPVDPLFRVGEDDIGYDQTRDRVGGVRARMLTRRTRPETGAVHPVLVHREKSKDGALGFAEVSQTGGVCPQCGRQWNPKAISAEEKWAFA